jgi:hypothetical protein
MQWIGVFGSDNKRQFIQYSTWTALGSYEFMEMSLGHSLFYFSGA